MSESKKPFRIVGIPHGKNIVTYAKKLEETMNKMKADDYAFQVSEHKTGTLIIGQYVEPLPGMQTMFRRGEPTAASMFSARTSELVHRFMRLPSRGGEFATFAADVKQNVVLLTRGFTAEELTIAAKEVEAAGIAHAATPEHKEGDCPFPEAMRAIAEALRGQATAQLQ